MITVWFVLASAATLAADTPQPFDATIIEDKTFVFEQPSALGNVLRRAYVGEVVRVTQEVETAEGRRWVQVALGYDRTGYIESARVIPTSRMKVTQYRPETVVREELPLEVGVRVGGETLGTGIFARYQPFSRLGISTSFGGLVAADNGRLGITRLPDSTVVHGTVISAGITSFLVLWNLSPVFELGLSRIAYVQGPATLNMTSVYVSAGIEWMFNRGAFLGVALSYVRSLSESVSYNYTYARGRTITVPDFGALGNGEDTFQQLEPSVVAGYAF
jgi:hypothetical protein